MGLGIFLLLLLLLLLCLASLDDLNKCRRVTRFPLKGNGTILYSAFSTTVTCITHVQYSAMYSLMLINLCIVLYCSLRIINMLQRIQYRVQYCYI